MKPELLLTPDILQNPYATEHIEFNLNNISSHEPCLNCKCKVCNPVYTQHVTKDEYTHTLSLASGSTISGFKNAWNVYHFETTFDTRKNGVWNETRLLQSFVFKNLSDNTKIRLDRDDAIKFLRTLITSNQLLPLNTFSKDKHIPTILLIGSTLRKLNISMEEKVSFLLHYKNNETSAMPL